MITWKEFHKKLDIVMQRNPQWRRGQAVFNVAHDMSPDFLNGIRSGPADPFYQDKKLNAFYAAAFQAGFLVYDQE